ncbi:MAG: hypothetical protein BRD55_07320 [Bacteroidetes bacterium SW_9_63_38]|nr:MAG: hypothetical protein BRD55_07320 [Bacteroidetes bacterium SW_9_63_38]
MEPRNASDALVPPSLLTLLDDILDYAGLLPPAALSLPQALRGYTDHREEPESWFLSRFVLPVRQLPDLPPHKNLFVNGPPVRFSVLGTGGPDRDAFLDAFARDLEVINDFDVEYGGQTQVDVMEVPLPTSAVGDDQSALNSFFTEVDRRLIQTGTVKLDLFLELPMQPSAVDALPALCAAVAEHNSRQAIPARSTMGLKVRCGGRAPSDVPSVEALAALIVACRDARVPFKAATGLQHPIRHYDDGLDTEMHGFVSLFAAAVLAVEHQLDPEHVQTILREETANNFRFEKEHFSWRNLSASLDGIRHTRDHLARSFSSCSFENPIDHLRDLDLL